MGQAGPEWGFTRGAQCGLPGILLKTEAWGREHVASEWPVAAGEVWGGPTNLSDW